MPMKIKLISNEDETVHMFSEMDGQQLTVTAFSMIAKFTI